MTAHASETRTEALALDLLRIQGWPTNRPPGGRVLRQNEYRAFPVLQDLFSSKRAGSAAKGLPDLLGVGPEPHRPRLVIEAKARPEGIDQAVAEACEDYGSSCIEAGYPVLAVGVAGQERTRIRVAVFKHQDGHWQPVRYQGLPISWLPTPEDTDRLLASPTLLDLAPVVPSQEVLAAEADRINRILREAKVKDEFRPATVGAMMLALWQSHGDLRRDPRTVLDDVNDACARAFQDAGKGHLAQSLRVEEANRKLAARAWEILATLEKLNVVSANVGHDYLGQLYENFFRYTGGNTIGQYFTPRHITAMMADLCEVSPSDVVIDPACGTGGFLIAALQRVVEKGRGPAGEHLSYDQAVTMVADKLVGFESEPVTAALAVANMILRGDGRSGIRGADCFTATDYPLGQCDVALMNPPFPHRKTDTPQQRFVERALEALRRRGLLAIVLTTSLLAKRGKEGAWRARILQEHTLRAVIQLPDELFQPFASATTSVVVIEKGVPHSANRQTVFVRLEHDGLTLKKGVRVPRADGLDQVELAVEVVQNRRQIPGFSGLEVVSGTDEWSVGASIPSAPASPEALRDSVDELMRRWASFYVRYGAEVARQRQAQDDGLLAPLPYRELLTASRLANAAALPDDPGTIGGLFDIVYGQKELHSRDGIPPGDTLVVSPTEQYNGCYGWLEFSTVIAPPFVTAAQTGSIGEAFVQTEACGVNDDCLVLLPKVGARVPLARMFMAAAAIRLERWRFTYGRKLTPGRIASFVMPDNPELEAWVAQRLRALTAVAEASVAIYDLQGDVTR